ncbi:glycosyltransferase [Acidithiobacillus thiooxidans]|uniref:glycosyltransferase n=1 Tax=Acidithiobacillus TaxID=119977 RepID=UPI00187A5E06|nr:MULTISPECIES: glycosyltransferase [Acidithiobacillus]MBE7565684.1 glycosyltransferase [Acidithiobacillus sp. HP-11]MBU2751959.1 glycosyltransferase [Acidithiobacillus thiooxidans]MBU2792346.1 glycosyltransferase [Acidithiobacillus thiooxidans]
MTMIHKISLCIVIVSYGDRAALLYKVLKSLNYDNSNRIVVVNNGAAWSLKKELTSAYGNWVDIVELGNNTGSSQGFAAGIKRAIELGAEYICLLDDDNCPKINTFEKLLNAFIEAVHVVPRDKLSVLAFRPEHQADVAMGVPLKRINPHPNSFQWFHIADIPYKIWRRTPWGKPRLYGTLPTIVPLEMAPYSGLLFHRDLIKANGLPNPDFILYADDIDFTHRIIERGGKILLVTDAIIEDLESSWNVKSHYSNSFVGLLKGDGDFRAYYTMRNTSYFFSRKIKTNNFVFHINLYIYLIILFIYAIKLRKLHRFRLIKKAIDEGLSGHLGLNERFPL